MSCYHHQEASAVAHCSFCSKHLCKACSKIQSNRTVCQDPKCAEAIDLFDQLSRCSAKIYNINGDKKRVIPWLGLSFLSFGALFAFYNYFIDYEPSFLMTVLSIMMFVIGGLMIRRARKWGMDI